jgi:Skp family chaperone for outer membrane proteins
VAGRAAKGDDMMFAKRWLHFFLLSAGVLAIYADGASAADDRKIAVIDSQRIFADYQPAKDAESVFQEEMRQWKEELGAMEVELLDLRERIKSQALLLSREKLDELQTQLDTKLKTYEQRKDELFNPSTGKAVTRNQELSAPINEQITTVVERVGSEEGFDIILDLATVNVVYVADGVDITDIVLGELTSGEN